jgi:hypothetical protein
MGVALYTVHITEAGMCQKYPKMLKVKHLALAHRSEPAQNQVRPSSLGKASKRIESPGASGRAPKLGQPLLRAEVHPTLFFRSKLPLRT